MTALACIFFWNVEKVMIMEKLPIEADILGENTKGVKMSDFKAK